VRLATPRLLLRPLEPADADDLARLANDREIADMTLVIPHPYGLEDAAAFIRNAEERRTAGDAEIVAITRRDPGELLGVIGLHPDVVHERAEIGFWIGRPHGGKGYCSEAARGVALHAFGDLALHRLFAFTFVENLRSQRVLTKLGMRQEGVMREHVLKNGVFRDLVVFGMSRGDLPSQPQPGGPR
jgi:[ribosomal protein S5]-alanine N-acetyltransferase